MLKISVLTTGKDGIRYFKPEEYDIDFINTKAYIGQYEEYYGRKYCLPEVSQQTSSKKAEC